MKNVPISIKVGVWLWLSSWVFLLYVDKHLGLAVFVTSYIAILHGLWKVVESKT